LKTRISKIEYVFHTRFLQSPVDVCSVEIDFSGYLIILPCRKWANDETDEREEGVGGGREANLPFLGAAVICNFHKE
jgi:hypothetical protein